MNGLVKYRSEWSGNENRSRALLSKIGAVNCTHIGQVTEMTFRKRIVYVYYIKRSGSGVELRTLD